MASTQDNHNYRLMVTEKRGGPSREFAYEGFAADSGYILLQRHQDALTVEIFEDERLIGRLSRCGPGDIWIVS